MLWPSQVGTLTYVWWYGNNTEVSWPSWSSPMIEARLMLAGSPTGWAYGFESEVSLNFHDSRTSVLKSSSGSSLSPTSIWLIQLPALHLYFAFHLYSLGEPSRFIPQLRHWTCFLKALTESLQPDLTNQTFHPWCQDGVAVYLKIITRKKKENKTKFFCFFPPPYKANFSTRQDAFPMKYCQSWF